jgi:hypothetical protein
MGKARDPFNLVAIALGNFAFSDNEYAMTRCMAPWGLSEKVVKLEATFRTPINLGGTNKMVAFVIRAQDNIFVVFRCVMVR